MSNDNIPERRRDGFLQRLKNRLMKTRDKGLSQDLQDVIETHEAQNPGGDLGTETKSMMRNLIAFSDLRVDDVMVPRADILAIELIKDVQLPAFAAILLAQALQVAIGSHRIEHIAIKCWRAAWAVAEAVHLLFAVLLRPEQLAILD